MTEMEALWKSSNLTAIANVGSLVQPLTRAQYLAGQTMPSNLFSHCDQQSQWQTSIPNGIATSGWGGRAADQVSYLNAPSTFPTLVSLAGNVIFGTAAALKTVFPKTNLGNQLQEVAKLMRVRQSMGLTRQIFFASLGGFDTHIFDATVELGIAEKVTTCTESAFSRTLQPNSNGGTDHDWGGHHLALGGTVKGASSTLRSPPSN